MITEEDEFKRIEAEIKRREDDDDDDTQAYTSETVAVKAYRLGYEACAKVAHRHPSKGEYMTDLRQAAQQALEALIDAANVLSAPMFADSVDALRTALEQPEQEPVAWMVTYGGLTHVEYTLPNKVVDTHYQPLYTTPPAAQPPAEWESIKNIIAEYGLQAIDFVAEWKAAQQQAEPAIALYTTPPQRTWVGLTGVEFNHIWAAHRDSPEALMLAVQSKLKEKNT